MSLSLNIIALPPKVLGRDRRCNRQCLLQKKKPDYSSFKLSLSEGYRKMNPSSANRSQRQATKLLGYFSLRWMWM